MPYYVIFAKDRRPDGPQLRARTRPAHLEFIRELGDRVKLAGMLLDDDGEMPAGSMLVLEVNDMKSAQQIAEEDPYAKAELFESVEIRAYRWTINSPEGA